MSDLFIRPMFTWRSALASEFGPESPTTRHVLLTLACYMSDKGDSCFPSTRRLTEDTALSHRAVLTHLEIAERTGWIGRRERLMRGKGWKRMEYFAVIPPGVEAKIAERDAGEGRSPRKGDEGRSPASGGELQAHRGERGDTMLVKDVHLNSSLKSLNEEGRVPTASPVGKSPAAKAFNDYSGAFFERYQVEPPVSAKVRGQFSQLVARIGAERAAKVAVAYVRDDNEFYRRVKHSPGILLKDCERIDVELRQAEKARAAREERWWEDPGKVAERARTEGIKPEQGDSYARIAARLFVRLGDGPWMHKLDPLVAKYVREYSERGVPA